MARVIDSNIWPAPEGAGNPADTPAGLSIEQAQALVQQFGDVDLRRAAHAPDDGAPAQPPCPTVPKSPD